MFPRICLQFIHLEQKRNQNFQILFEDCLNQQEVKLAWNFWKCVRKSPKMCRESELFGSLGRKILHNPGLTVSPKFSMLNPKIHCAMLGCGWFIKKALESGCCSLLMSIKFHFGKQFAIRTQFWLICFRVEFPINEPHWTRHHVQRRQRSTDNSIRDDEWMNSKNGFELAVRWWFYCVENRF